MRITFARIFSTSTRWNYMKAGFDCSTAVAMRGMRGKSHKLKTQISDYGQSNYTSCFIHTSCIHAGLFEPLKLKLTKASAILLSFQSFLRQILDHSYNMQYGGVKSSLIFDCAKAEWMEVGTIFTIGPCVPLTLVSMLLIQI